MCFLQQLFSLYLIPLLFTKGGGIGGGGEGIKCLFLDINPAMDSTKKIYNMYCRYRVYTISLFRIRTYPLFFPGSGSVKKITDPDPGDNEKKMLFLKVCFSFSRWFEAIFEEKKFYICWKFFRIIQTVEKKNWKKIEMK